jgi:hypothetical protein
MGRQMLAAVLAITNLLALAATARAQGPVSPLPSGQVPPYQPGWPGIQTPLYYYYTPRDVGLYSSPAYSHIWQPAYPLPPYQMRAYTFWYQTAYGPYMRATGYSLPALP